MESRGPALPAGPVAGVKRAWSVLQRYGFAQTALLAGLRERPLGWLNGWTPDLLLLTVLLAATAAGGRAFAKLAVGGHPVYPTELLLLAVLALAVARCGAAGAVARLRTLLPLWAVGTLWVAGAIATLRGLSWGLGNVAHDVGLVEYSVLLAVAALVADTPERARRTVNALLVAGIVAVPAYQIAWDTSPTASFGHWENPGVAVAIYLSVSILVVGARLFFAVPPPLPMIAVAIWSVWLMTHVGARSALVAFSVAIAAVIAMLPRRRLGAVVILVAALVVYVFGPWTWQGFPAQAPNQPPPPAPPVVAPFWVADDALTGVLGGGIVTGDGASGTHDSLQSARGLPLQVPVLLGLRPGGRYVVRFWVKASQPTTGYVGNDTGSGWQPQPWSVPGGNRWHAVRAVLVARAPQDLLEIVFEKGPRLVLVDGLTVARRGTFGLPRPAPAPAAPRITWREHLPPVLHDIAQGFNASDTSGANANAQWRLAIWKYMLGRTIHGDPLLGIGFGRPTNFLYHGILFDGRKGDPSNPNDEIPPHNSFVNLLFRTGLLGFVALLALLAIAARRVLRARRRGLAPRDGADLVALAGVFAFTCAIAFLNAALEGPYMSLFFWLPLGLLLVIPKLSERGPDARRW